MQRAAANGPSTPQSANDVAAALEALYIHQFAIEHDRDTGVRSGEASLAAGALEKIIRAGEAFTLYEVHIPEEKLSAFLALAEVAREMIVDYIEAIRLDNDVILYNQSSTLSLLVRVLEVTLVFMGIIGVSAVLLLHREVVSRRKRDVAERKADYLAYNDAMPGLANRQSFNDRLGELMATKQKTAMLFLDLDDFKSINDTYGHGFGDVVLQSVATRLRGAVENYGGMAARLGGDKFGALLTTDNATKLGYLFSEILEKTAEPISSEGVTVHARVSIGVATSTEVQNATDLSPEAMSRAADFALYESKESGRGIYRIYDWALDERYVAHRSLLDAIPAALDNQEFFVAYQPKVMLSDAQIYGF